MTFRETYSVFVDESGQRKMLQSLQVVIIKPSKYMADGQLYDFAAGLCPTALSHTLDTVPSEIHHVRTETHAIDEYVDTDLNYLKLLKPARNFRTCSIGRGAKPSVPPCARSRGTIAAERLHGGYRRHLHVITCDTSMLHGKDKVLCSMRSRTRLD